MNSGAGAGWGRLAALVHAGSSRPQVQSISHVLCVSEMAKKGVTVAIIKPNVVEEGKVDEVMDKVGPSSTTHCLYSGGGVGGGVWVTICPSDS